MQCDTWSGKTLALALHLSGTARAYALRGDWAPSQVAKSDDTCRFPDPAAPSHPGEPHLRINSTCPATSMSRETMKVETSGVPGGADASPRLYVDTRSTVYDMSAESSFADAPSVKVATIGGANWRPTQSASLAQLRANLQMAKDDGAAIACMFEYSLKSDAPMTLDGPELAAVRSIAREVGLVVICPLNLSPAGCRGSIRRGNLWLGLWLGNRRMRTEPNN